MRRRRVEYFADLRADCLRRGVCPKCRKRPVVSGRKQCAACIVHDIKRKSIRELRGKCVVCGRDTDRGKVCIMCIEHKHKWRLCQL